MGRRFFRHGELPLVILNLLRVRPMHGYQLMGELTTLFGPTYRPSAGSIYPAVESLEIEGLIGGQDQDARRVYRLTRAGRSALEQRRHLVAALEIRTGVRLPSGDGADAHLTRFVARVGAVAPRIAVDDLDRILDRTASEIEALAAPSSRPASGPRRHLP